MNTDIRLSDDIFGCERRCEFCKTPVTPHRSGTVGSDGQTRSVRRCLDGFVRLRREGAHPFRHRRQKRLLSSSPCLRESGSRHPCRTCVSSTSGPETVCQEGMNLGSTEPPTAPTPVAGWLVHPNTHVCSSSRGTNCDFRSRRRATLKKVFR